MEEKLFRKIGYFVSENFPSSVLITRNRTVVNERSDLDTYLGWTELEMCRQTMWVAVLTVLFSIVYYEVQSAPECYCGGVEGKTIAFCGTKDLRMSHILALSCSRTVVRLYSSSPYCLNPILFSLFPALENVYMQNEQLDCEPCSMLEVKLVTRISFSFEAKECRWDEIFNFIVIIIIIIAKTPLLLLDYKLKLNYYIILRTRILFLFYSQLPVFRSNSDDDVTLTTAGVLPDSGET